MMRRPAHQERARRGFTLIEALIALAVMAIGLLGLASLQVVGVRANHFGRKMALASALVRDLADTVQRWDYGDARLAAPRPIVTSTTDTTITSRWDMGRATTASYTADYAEQAGDANATNQGQLTAVNYDGLLATRIDPDYADAATVPVGVKRYWNVFTVDVSGSGASQGKLVQIIVRWREPGLGMRQIAGSTFRPNPAASGL
jgi:prepilin-type N-terminal cleavage/methylation domain-containing protein